MTHLPTSLADGSPIPEMRDALLSAEDVHALVADLTTHAHVTNTLCKAGPRQQTPPHNLPLTDAVEMLLARSVTAIQIRYEYDDHHWTDTLLHIPGGIRLVRCQHVPQ
jgi:hypothetical protein